MNTSVNYLDLLQSIAHIGIIELNKKNDSFYISQEVYFLLGTKKNEVYADYTSFLHFVHPEDRELVAQTHDSISVDSSEYSITYRIVRENEEIRYIEEKGSYTFNEENEIISISGFIFDITEKYLLNKELQNLNQDLDKKIQEEILKNTQKDQQLFAQSRLAQMGEMISMIAHQWRQPLSAISTTVIDLEMRMELESYDLNTLKGQEECHQYFRDKFENIGLYVNNLTRTIDDFRNFYKPNKEPIMINFETIVKKSVNIIRGSFKNNNIDLEYNYALSQDIQMHDNEMMQVILNILQNSVDNFKEKQVEYPKIMITTEEKKLLICDNGGGIDDTIIEKIFDPYFSTKNEKNGTGLGLYMSNIIINEHHKGKIKAYNTEDGVCFLIDLKENKND